MPEENSQKLLENVLSPQELEQLGNATRVEATREVSHEVEGSAVQPLDRLALFGKGGEWHTYFQLSYKSPRGFKTMMKLGKFNLEPEADLAKKDLVDIDADNRVVHGRFVHAIEGCHSSKKYLLEDEKTEGKFPIRKGIALGNGQYSEVQKDSVTDFVENPKNLPRTKLETFLPEKYLSLVVSDEESTMEAKRMWKDLMEHDEMVYLPEFVHRADFGAVRRAVIFPVGSSDRFGFCMILFSSFVETEKFLMREEGPVKVKSKKAKKNLTGKQVQVKLVDI